MVNDSMHAYNSTATVDVSQHQSLPPGFSSWVILSSRGCCHREHIDPARACTLIAVDEGVKFLLLGYSKNPSASSWNPTAGHHPASISEDVLYELVVIEAGNYL